MNIKDYKTLLSETGYENNRRGFAINMYKRATSSEEGGSFFASAFHNVDDATLAFHAVTRQLDMMYPAAADEYLIMPPLDCQVVPSISCGVDIDGVVTIVMTDGLAVPACNMLHTATTDFLNILIELYSTKATEPVTMENVSSALLSGVLSQ